MNEVIQAHGTGMTPTPADLLRFALENGADLDRLERLMDLQAKYEAGQARKAFHAAMTQFKLNPIVIAKDKHVKFATKAGVTEYSHASLAEVVDSVVILLAKAGISHSWSIQQQAGKNVVVTCILTHEMGHSESVTMEAQWDETGNKNNIQAVASTATYLSRHTLLLACGLASRDMPDDDGHGATPELARDGHRDHLWSYLKPHADKGTAALSAAWKAAAWITDKEGKERIEQAAKDRELVGDWLAKLKDIAAKADAAAAQPEKPEPNSQGAASA